MFNRLKWSALGGLVAVVVLGGCVILWSRWSGKEINVLWFACNVIIYAVLWVAISFAFDYFQVKGLREIRQTIADKDEIIFDSPATRIAAKGPHWTGWLYLTGSELIFVNRKKIAVRIPLTEICEVYPEKYGLARTILIVPKNENVAPEKFSIYGRKQWLKEISVQLTVDNPYEGDSEKLQETED